MPNDLRVSSSPEAELVIDPNAGYHEVVFSEEWKKHKPPEYFAYRDDWTRIPKDKITSNFPINLDIETTTKCNLKCGFCARTILVDKGNFHESGFMTREDFSRIIDEGVKHGLRSIKLNYLGEPLLHKDVFWQVEYAKSKGIIDVIMNSNATALTEKNAEALLRAGLDAYLVSFDAINPQTYERQRVGGHLGQVIDNVYRFIKLRNKIRPSCQVRLSMIMHPGPEFRAQWEGLKAMWGGLVDAVAWLTYHDTPGPDTPDHPYFPGFYCTQPFQRMFIKNNGNVTACCVDSSDTDVVGNWKNENLYDIWHGKRLTEIRELHATNRYNEMDLCRKCHMPLTYQESMKP